MEQCNRKDSAMNGLLTGVLKHSYCVNFSKPELSLQGDVSAINQDGREQNRVMSSNDNIEEGTVKRQFNSLDLQRESNSFEFKTQTLMLPSRYKQLLSRKQTKVCQIFSMNEPFNRHLVTQMKSREPKRSTIKFENIAVRLSSGQTDYNKKLIPEKTSQDELIRTVPLSKRFHSNETGKRALNCVLSRNDNHNSNGNIDLDYQYFNLQNLNIYDGNYDNDIDVSENRGAHEPTFPPLSASKCKIMNRYTSGLISSPSTPFLREYARISFSKHQPATDITHHGPWSTEGREG